MKFKAGKLILEANLFHCAFINQKELWMAEIVWCELKVVVPTEYADLVAELFLEEGAGGVVHEDPAILDSKVFDIDELVDETFKNTIGSEYAIKAYFPVDDTLGTKVSLLKEKIQELVQEEVSLELKQICEDDWAHAWKAYYKPEQIGKIVIKPSWEAYEPSGSEQVIEMDPGMAFGTGTHPTTRLCIKLLQEVIKHPLDVLDLGTGSGILAITAAKLGAARVVASDIDAVAVKVAIENVVRNNLADTVNVIKSDLLKEHSDAKYDLVVANIIADVILQLIPEVKDYLKQSGLFVISGIIEGRLAEIESSLEQSGFQIQQVEAEAEWRAIVAVNCSPVI